MSRRARGATFLVAGHRLTGGCGEWLYLGSYVVVVAVSVPVLVLNRPRAAQPGT